MRASTPCLLALVLASCGTGPYDLLASGRDAGCANGRYQCFAETVYQPSTGLSWRRRASTPLSWQAASDACHALAPEGTWKLPTAAQLDGLAQPGTRPQIDLDAFADTLAAEFWTSDDFSSLAATALDFGTLTRADESKSLALASRCVHRGR